jgi:hypothetical protein
MEKADTTEQRRGRRKGVLKRAQIVVDGVVFNCVVENLSATGAKLRLGVPTPLPEAFAVRFPDGTSHAARRSWSRGTTVGVAFEAGSPAAEAEQRHLVEAVREASLAADPAAMLGLLRAAWFFGDETLRRAAADLELAQVRFTAALAPHMGAGSSAAASTVEGTVKRPRPSPELPAVNETLPAGAVARAGVRNGPLPVYPPASPEGRAFWDAYGSDPAAPSGAVPPRCLLAQRAGRRRKLVEPGIDPATDPRTRHQAATRPRH